MLPDVPSDRRDDARREAQALADGGASVEAILVALRAADFAPVDCVRALRDVFGLSFQEADEKVLYSEAWADFRQPTIELRETFRDALEGLADEGA